MTLTAGQLEEGIGNALKAGDIEAVGDMLHALAVVDPQRAEAVMDVLKVAVSLSKKLAADSNETPSGGDDA